MKYEKRVTNTIVSGVGKSKIGGSSWTILVESNVRDPKTGEWGKESEKFNFKLDETGPLEEVKNGKSYFIAVRPDGKGSGEILQLRPAMGTYPVRMVGFSMERDDDSKLLIINNKGEFGQFWQIVAELEVASGGFAGVKYPLYLPLADEDKETGNPRLKFEIEDGLFNVYVGKKSGEKVKMFRDLVHYTGLDTTKLPLTEEDLEEAEVDEILKVVGKVAKKLKKVFSATIENGKPKTLSPYELDEEEVEEEVVEEVPAPKKKAKVEVVEEDDEPEVVAPPAKKKVVAKKPIFDEDDEE